MKSTLPLPSKVNILMIYDKPENLKLLTQILSKQEYKIGVSPSGKLALNASHSNSPDLILLDINRAEMDGYKVYQYLEVSEQTKEIPVIFISSLDEHIKTRNCLN